MEVLTTNGVMVCVETKFAGVRVENEQEQYFFSYFITIQNSSPYTIQLLRRKWLIFDSVGVVRLVEGEGVVGEQPILSPGAAHSYSSYCNLTTEMGKMHGIYLMQRQSDGVFFEVEIPQFFMCAPFKLN